LLSTAGIVSASVVLTHKNNISVIIINLFLSKTTTSNKPTNFKSTPIQVKRINVNVNINIIQHG
jgi:hypothetical protein